MFQKSILRKYLNLLDEEKTQKSYELFKATFLNPEKQENIRNSVETQYQEGFCRDLFCQCLGYTINPEPGYNLITEQKNENDKDNRKADAAIILNGKVVAVIELKGCDTADLNKVENQAFGYKAHQKGCRYVIISNFERLRLYIDDASDALEFNLFNLSYAEFKELCLCLALEQIQKDIPAKLKAESVSNEKEITAKFYKVYSGFKKHLFSNMVERNPDISDKLLLFQKTQKLLDRFLFIFFCEDRGLLSPNTVAQIISDWNQLKALDAYQPLYNRFKLQFKYINEGHDNPHVFGYNGGLFREDEILDRLNIDDDVLLEARQLADYDFESDVSVDILGHIFEHSLSEIEEIQEQIIAERNGIQLDSRKKNKNGKRKKDGIYYTPAYITKYIVENTIGRLCEEKKRELHIDDETYARRNKKRNKSAIKQLEDVLNQYKQWLLSLKICDPACGSGDFLNSALAFLQEEHRLIDIYRAHIFGDSLNLSYVDDQILENNLYGVDINEESVEITKLSLWLQTAKPGRKLTTLSNNIKCGNSLIDDPAVAGDKAFCWEREFPEIFANGGFDVVIGNPPYGASVGLKEEEFIKQNYKSYEYQFNSYSVFYEKGLNICQNNGYLGYITPSTFTYQHYFSNLRAVLNKHSTTCVRKYLYEVFPDADIGFAITWITRKGSSGNQFIDIKSVIDESQALENGSLISSQIFIKNDGSYAIQKDCFDWSTHQTNCTYLDRISTVVVGIKAYQSGKGIPKQDAEIVKNKIFTSSECKNNTYIECVSGEDINRYRFTTNKLPFLSYGKWLAEPREGAPFFEEKKIILRQTSDSLIATIDDKRRVNLNNIYNIGFIDKQFNICYILALLNSRYLNYIYQDISQEKGRPFAEVKKTYLVKLPVYQASLEQQQPLIVLADAQLAANQKLQNYIQKFLNRLQSTLGVIKISKKLNEFYKYDFAVFCEELKKQKIKLSLRDQDEWEDYFNSYRQDCSQLLHEIDENDREIDRLVYQLYGLTDEEIAVVEGR